ncbi:MAG: DUF3768 domain-containing protein [Hyphomicrobiaceae bacterium]
MTDDRTARIRALNDAFRRAIGSGQSLGKFYMTSGVAGHGPAFTAKVIAAVVAFDAFDADIDPYGEHDMVRVVVDGIRVWGKIDYYHKADPDLGAEDPADAGTTERVMTLLLPEEY